MKDTTIVFTTVLIFVFLFGARPISEESPVVIREDFYALRTNEPPNEKLNIDDEFEEYPVEDYFDEMYTETECQDCLRSSESDGCLEVHTDCLDLPDCTDWISCVGWCEAYEADDDCYEQCDLAFIDSKKVEVNLRLCVCELCAINCRVLCGVKEGY